MICANYISILTFVYTSVNKMLNTGYNFIYHRKCRTFVVGKQEGGDSRLSLRIQYMDMKNAPPISDAKKINARLSQAKRSQSLILSARTTNYKELVEDIGIEPTTCYTLVVFSL